MTVLIDVLTSSYLFQDSSTGPRRHVRSLVPFLNGLSTEHIRLQGCLSESFLEGRDLRFIVVSTIGVGGRVV